jgi:predicted dehydrogenase
LKIHAEEKVAEGKKIRLGVIGAGGISQLSHIPNIMAERSAELVAICDTNPGRAAAVAERSGAVVWFDDAEQMFRQTALDGVVISSPTITHPALARLAMENGVDVLLEKPFARTLAEGRSIVESAEKNKRLLMTAMNHRFRPDSLHLRQVIKKREIGDITMIRAGWLRQLGVWGRPMWFSDARLAGGGVLMDLGLQMIDLVLFLTGFPSAIEVYGAADSRTLGLDVEDTASGFIRLSNNAIFLLEVSWANCDDHDKAYTWFSGTHGAAAMNPLRISKRQKETILKEKLPSFGDPGKLYKQSFRLEIAHFVDCIKTRQKPLSSGNEALAVLEIIEKLYRTAGL